MPEAIQVLVVIPWDFAPLPGRDNRGDLSSFKNVCKSIAVVSFIRQQVASVYAFDKLASLCAISNGTRCNRHSDWHTMRIHGQVYLGIEPPFVRPMS